MDNSSFNEMIFSMATEGRKKERKKERNEKESKGRNNKSYLQNYYSSKW
jgi:hypothetical protein